MKKKKLPAIWIFITLLILTYTISEAKATGESSGMIIFWDGNVQGTQGYIPPNWELVSKKPPCIEDLTWQCDFYNKTINITGTFGQTSGQDTHTGTISGSVSTPSSTDLIDPGYQNGFNVASQYHTGTLSATISSNTSLLPYRTLVALRYNNGIPPTIPNNAIAFFNSTTPPAGWSIYIPMEGKFLRGSETPNLTGGSTSHKHQDIDITLSGGSAAVGKDTGSNVNTPSHNHQLFDQTANETLHIPPHVNITMIRANGDQPIPTGLIAIFNSTPTPNWIDISSDPNFKNRLLQISTTSFNTTGGFPNHTHPSITGTTNTSDDTISKKCTKPSGCTTTVADHPHTHNISVNITSRNQPAYITVVLALFLGPAANESEGRQAIEQGINNALTSPIIYTDQQIYIVNSTEVHSAGKFDKVTDYGNQTWGFNYVTGGEPFTNIIGLVTGKIVNIWEEMSLTFGQIVNQVEAFINQTEI